jgi:hypothetical protein
MNPINEIIEFFENNGIIEFIENTIIDNTVIENIVIVDNPEINQINEPVVLNLGPPPILQRHPPFYDEAEEVEELIADAQFQEFQGYDTPNDFVMPEPCSRCYWVQCNGTCEMDTPFIQTIRAKQLSFEEEMDLPPPPALSRISARPLLDEEWRRPPPLTRGYTDSHLSDEILASLAEAESNMRDEYEAALFEQLQAKAKEQDGEQDGQDK